MRASIVVAAALAVLVAAGCGGDGGGDEPRAGKDLTAISCPMVPAGEVDGVARYEPARDAFDTAELVGMRLDDARGEATGHGCEVVVVSEDGRGLPVPVEIDPSRVYVFVERDTVTAIEGVGGGL